MSVFDYQLSRFQERVDNLEAALDSWFSYSSIKKVALFNLVCDYEFASARLIAASSLIGIPPGFLDLGGVEPVLYFHHTVWELAYPSYRLPENLTANQRAERDALIESAKDEAATNYLNERAK
jgi:hypothetical protein